jgi:hypothetical protein
VVCWWSNSGTCTYRTSSPLLSYIHSSLISFSYLSLLFEFTSKNVCYVCIKANVKIHTINSVLFILLLLSCLNVPFLPFLLVNPSRVHRPSSYAIFDCSLFPSCMCSFLHCQCESCRVWITIDRVLNEISLQLPGSILLFLPHFFFLVELGFVLRTSCLQKLLYCLSHTASPFCSGYFGDTVSWSICLGWLWTTVLPISAFQAPRITGLSHWCMVSSQFSKYLIPYY